MTLPQDLPLRSLQSLAHLLMTAAVPSVPVTSAGGAVAAVALGSVGEVLDLSPPWCMIGDRPQLLDGGMVRSTTLVTL